MNQGDPQTIAVQAPFAMLWKTANSCEFYADALRRQLAVRPSTMQDAWGLVVYWDEVSPSNPLAKGKDLRKVQGVNWTFEELDDLWSCEYVWFELCAVRSDLVEKMKGGMSQLIRRMMLLFFDPAGFDILNAGIQLNLYGEHVDAAPTHLFARHSFNIADYPAHTEVLGNRTHNASKPCCCCRNVVDHKSGLADVVGSGLVPLTSLDVDAWRQHSDSSVRALAVRLRDAHGTMGVTAFSLKQQTLGWTYNEHSILYDTTLPYSPVESIMFDWMHIWLIDGIFLRELNILLRTYASHDANINIVDDLRRYLHAWTWPKQVASARHLFDTGSFQATASETLGVYPVIAKFFRDVAPRTPQTRLALDSFALCCKCLDVLTCAQRKASTPSDLHTATTKFLEAHLVAYGSEVWVWKHHGALHLARMWARRRGLPNCFSLERKHKGVKRIMMNFLKKQSYERSVIEEVTLEHLHECNTKAAFSRLENPHLPSKALAAYLREAFPAATSFHVSRTYVASDGMRIMSGDVVFARLGDELICAELALNVQIDGTNKCIGSAWQFMSQGKSGVSKFKIGDSPFVSDSSAIVCALLYKRCSDVCTVICPPWVRH